jgi:hypothetical protein
MAGRPRRHRASSTSTATSISTSAGTASNSTQIRWVNESLLLKPRPQDVPANDWPTYVLNDATVYRKDGKTLANPLLLPLEGSVVIRGRIEADDNVLSNRKSSAARDCPPGVRC